MGQGADDYILVMFWRILAVRATVNELLGGGLHFPSAFLVVFIFYADTLPLKSL